MASSFRYGTPFDDLLDDAGVASTIVTFAGGRGNDTYSVLLSRGNDYEVVELPGEGVDTFRVQGNGTDFISLEDLPGIENLEIAGLNFVDGNAEANLIRTIAGTDATLFDGRGGRDTLIGGAGDDTYRVDDSSVVIVELTGEGRDLVRTSVSYVLPAGVENAVADGGLTVPQSVTGNALDNEIDAFGGRQRLAGLAGNDTLSAGDGNDTLQGGDGNDSLLGSSGADLVEGGAGADTISGGADNDTLVGGAGDDSYAFVASIDVVIEAAGGGTDRISANATVFVLPANVEILLPGIGGSLDFTGNTGANHITGGNSADVLRGLAGDDRLDGAGGNDTLSGDLGNDTLDGGTGTDSLSGGAGNDEYRVDAAADAVVEAAGAGRDRVWSSVAVFALPENVEELLLVLGSAASIGRGNALDNVITGNEASNQLEGGAGNDRLDGGRDPGDGPTGDDGAPDILIGGLGNDTFVVSDGDIAVEAADGGRDLLIMTGQWGETGPYFMPAHIEDATFLAAEGNAFIGNALANRITGSADQDSIDGGGGSDTLAGGGGDDSYEVNLATDVVVEAVGAGFDTVFASSSFVLPANVEQLVFRAGAQPLPGATRVVGTGNAGADHIDAGELATSAQLAGLAGNDSLTGGSAADTLQGGTANDTLAGGAGPNRLEGGAGDDVYQVTDATDVIVELANEGRDRIEALFNSPGFVLPANVEDLTLTEGVSFSSATGNGLDNRILGNAGFNTLNGLAGNDFLDGGGATDFMTGGPGNDTYVVDDDNDTTAEDANGGIDLIRSTISIVLGAGRENIENVDLLETAASAVGNALGNRITGNVAANTLAGSGGDDRLEGREGNDSLDGGSGRDTMVGGAGNDTYAVDQVTDVVNELAGEGNDQIFLSVAGVAVFTLPNHVESLVNLGASGVRITGNALDNPIFGGAGADTLDGGAGNDTLSGSALDDVLSGGAGNDRLDGGAGADSMTGGAGDDTYVVTTGDGLGGGGQLVTEDRVIELAGGGIDKVQFGSTAGSYVLPDHVEKLESLAGPTSFAITGNALDNELSVSSSVGNVSLAGGAGNDLLSALNVGTGAGVALSFDGGPGQDRLVLGLSGPGASLFALGIEETTFQVGAGTTTLSNGGGLLAGRVVMQGPGSLTLNASSSVRDYVFNGYSGTLVATGTGSVLGGERAFLELRGPNPAGFIAADLERFDITTTGTVTSLLELAGNSSLTTLAVQGTAGLRLQNFGTSMTSVVLKDFTGGNNLVLLPVSAVNADLVTVTPDGSFGGIDFAGYGTDANTFVFSLSSGAAPSLLQAFGMSAGSAVSVTGDGELDLRGFEAGIVNVTASGVLAFELGAVAGATFDATLASAASIRVTGGSGNDTLSFGSSLDSRDQVDGGAGTDTLNAIVTGLRAATTGRLDVGSSVENFNATVGSGGGVTETSLDGSDIRAGATSILNGTGAASALLRVVNASGAWDGFSNGGFDGRLDIRASAFASDVNFNGGDGDDTLTGADADDILFGGGGGDLLRGGDGADQVLGGNGNDALFGEAGDDLLSAGLGLDGMTGGTGADRFQFEELNGASNAANADTISDFESGVDVIQFENAVFTGLVAGALAPGAFRAGAGVSTAGDADDRIIYNTTNGKLFYDSDGLGGTAAVEVATLLGNGGFALPPVITVADILVV